MKKIQETIQLVNSIEEQSGLIFNSHVSGIQDLIVHYEKTNKGFSIVLKNELVNKYDLGATIPCEITILGIKYFSENALYIKQGMPNYISQETISISNFQNFTDNEESEAKWYNIYLISENLKLGYFRCIYDNVGNLNTEKVNLKINGIKFSIWNVYDGKSTYFITECIDNIKNKDFEKISFAICSAVGFLTGFFPQDQVYSFKYNSENEFSLISYRSLRQSMSHSYRPIPTNPHSYIKNHDEAKKWNEKIDKIPSNLVEKLIEKLISEDKLLNSILLFQSSGKLGLELSPIAIVTAIEALTSLAFDKVSPTKPINEASFDDLKVGFLRILEEKKDKLTSEEYTFTSNKLKNINSPTNKDKLSIPFKKLGINLSKYEEEALDMRNKFLHGSLPFNKGNISRDKLDELKILHGYLLCYVNLYNSLLLRYIDYEGYVINYLFLFKELVLGTSETDIFLKLPKT